MSDRFGSDSGPDSGSGSGSSPRSDPVLEATVSDGVCRLARPDTRFLSTGFDGGQEVADAAYNLTVPDGFDDRDLGSYVAERLDRAGFGSGAGSGAAPALLTGVDQTHARRARLGPVAAVATAGISNPAALPIADRDPNADVGGVSLDEHRHDGTVNVIAVTTRSLASGALANLLAVVAEAKAATLLATTGFPGTTSDAIVVGDDPDGEHARFSGSATPVGRAARVCVRDAVAASLRSRYAGTADSIPSDVADADHGVVSNERARVTPVDRDGDL
jgi:adenosylcobinamide hydrolase